MSGGGGSTTTQEIPDELKGLATQYANKGIELSNQGFTPYDQQRYAGFNPTQTAGFGATIDRAQNGSATFNNAESALNKMIDGGQTNPYLDQMVGKAQESVKSGFNTAAINSGSFGNSGLQEQYQKGLGDVAAGMYGNAYETDRNRQMQAIGMAPQFANQAYTDAGQLMKVGQIKQDQAQQGNDFAYSQYQDEQNLPYKQLAAMSGIFGSYPGGSTTTSGGGK